MREPDEINAVFELGSAILLTLNVVKLLKDKKLAGVSIFPTMWFNLWGVWNLHYYGVIAQPLSRVAGFMVFAMNTAWVALALYYERKWRPWKRD